ncbi:MAG: hypothetical protein PHV68_07670 [Candidatus Gastranaerophilales bacterium]|nr:hypothetical protein [Candidatus Gastranaerophilales bacterium]
MSVNFGLQAASASSYYGNASSNKYTSIRKQAIDEGKKQTVNSLDLTDFRETQDPVYIAFDYIDNRPVSKLASEFIQESIIQPVMKFISM